MIKHEWRQRTRRSPPPKATLDDILLAPTEEKRQALITEAKNSGRLEIKGDPNALTDFRKLLDDYPFWFNIVTP